MPYGERKEKAVTLASIPGLLYAFRTDVADGTSTALGHVDALAGGNYKQGVVFGINSPKPPKARKLFASANKRYEESFVSSGSIDTARAAGWEIRPGKIMSLRNTKFSKIVSVDFKIVDPVDAAEGVEAAAARTMRYAWRMPQYQYVKLTAADKTALGLDDFDADNLRSYVVGANSVRPRRAVKTITTTDGKSIRMTTFCAYNKEDSLDGSQTASGWALIE